MSNRQLSKGTPVVTQEVAKLAVLTAYPSFQVRKCYRGEDGSTYRAYDGRTWKAKVISPVLASRKRVIDYVAEHLTRPVRTAPSAKRELALRKIAIIFEKQMTSMGLNEGEERKDRRVRGLRGRGCWCKEGVGSAPLQAQHPREQSRDDEARPVPGRARAGEAG